MPKPIVKQITENWQREVLENIFGHEDLFDMRYDFQYADDDIEYEIEVVLRRKAKRKKKLNRRSKGA